MPTRHERAAIVNISGPVRPMRSPAALSTESAAVQSSSTILIDASRSSSRASSAGSAAASTAGPAAWMLARTTSTR